MTLSRLLRTVAPLRPIQIYGRALFRLKRPRINRAPAGPRRRLGAWAQAVPRTPRLTGADEIRLLNRVCKIDRSDCWNDASCDKLWLYNLHYFDELAVPADEERRKWQRALVARWIAENPPGAGNGWEPYTLSLRIVNWIKWALSGEPLEPAWLDSLTAQSRWLARRLEWHLLGNHLFANAKALIFAGLFFGGSEAEAWVARGTAILLKEIPEQILADGGHFELSPMYHSIILEDLLDILNLAEAAGFGQRTPFVGWREPVTRMTAWLAAMTHPDGDIAFFNDSAFAIAPAPVELLNYARRLGFDDQPAMGDGLTELAASGYIRLQQGDAVALLDVAAVGPSYLPGHAHADTLSFELSVRGRRVVVNGGTSAYVGRTRDVERSTRAHSTVEVAGLDSSEVWGSFRVGRRARATDAKMWRDADRLTVTAAHDGYRFLAGQPLHRRTWQIEKRALVIEDEIVGGNYPAVARLILAPGSQPVLADGGFAVQLGGAISVRSSASLALEPATWSPQFGRTVSTVAICASVGPGPLSVRIEW